MGIFDLFRSSNEQPQGQRRTFGSLEELEAAGYELIDVDERTGVIYASEKGVVTLKEDREDDPSPAEATRGEISASADSIWRRTRLTDYNPDLSGTRAIDKYKEMKNDALVRASLRVAKMPILSARWFMEPASQEESDLEKADFIWKNLTQWMSMSWPQFLTESLYMLDYGAYVFEKVFEFREWEGEQKVYWKKFAPRHPYDIDEFIYDDEGGPDAIKILTDAGDVDLPIWKALIFTFDREGGDLWGHSLLRSAYKHWFYKEQLYKIDAIQKERHGIGIPIIVLPQGYKVNDKNIAENIGMNLRTNESAHVVLPPGWEVHFLKLEGQRVDALASAQHHGEMLWENVLANFMLEATTQGNAEIQEHVFVRSVRFTAEIIRDTLNHYAIPQLCRLNWDDDELENGYPLLKVRRLGDERDWRVISFAVRNLVGSKTIIPDEKLEAWAREEMDMPVADPSTARDIDEATGPEGDDPDQANEDRRATGGTPRQPAVGPRQSPSAAARQGRGTGSRRVGTDGSGG